MTPISITVADENGVTEIPLTQDPHGWVARHGDMLIHLTAVRSGPPAVTARVTISIPAEKATVDCRRFKARLDPRDCTVLNGPASVRISSR